MTYYYNGGIALNNANSGIVNNSQPYYQGQPYQQYNCSQQPNFVITQGQQKEYYQIAYYLYDQKVIDREFGAFKEIRDNYPKYVISFDKMDFSRDGIIHKNVIDFLLE